MAASGKLLLGTTLKPDVTERGTAWSIHNNHCHCGVYVSPASGRGAKISSHWQDLQSQLTLRSCGSFDRRYQQAYGGFNTAQPIYLRCALSEARLPQTDVASCCNRVCKTSGKLGITHCISMAFFHVGYTISGQALSAGLLILDLASLAWNSTGQTSTWISLMLCAWTVCCIPLTLVPYTHRRWFPPNNYECAWNCTASVHPIFASVWGWGSKSSSLQQVFCFSHGGLAWAALQISIKKSKWCTQACLHTSVVCIVSHKIAPRVATSPIYVSCWLCISWDAPIDARQMSSRTKR